MYLFWHVYPYSTQSSGYNTANCKHGLNINDLCFFIDYFEVGLESLENVEMFTSIAGSGWLEFHSILCMYACTWLEIFIMERSPLQCVYFSEPELPSICQRLWMSNSLLASQSEAHFMSLKRWRVWIRSRTRGVFHSTSSTFLPNGTVRWPGEGEQYWKK